MNLNLFKHNNKKKSIMYIINVLIKNINIPLIDLVLLFV